MVRKIQIMVLQSCVKRSKRTFWMFGFDWSPEMPFVIECFVVEMLMFLTQSKYKKLVQGLCALDSGLWCISVCIVIGQLWIASYKKPCGWPISSCWVSIFWTSFTYGFLFFICLFMVVKFAKTSPPAFFL